VGELVAAPNPFQGAILQILGWIGLGLSVVFAFWALYLGFKMASATDEQKRKDAKKRMFHGIVSMVLILMLVGLLQLVNFITHEPDDIEIYNHEFPLEQWTAINILSGSFLSQGSYSVTITEGGAEVRWGPTGWEIRGTALGPATIRIERAIIGPTTYIPVTIVPVQTWEINRPPPPPHQPIPGAGEFIMPLSGSVRWVSSANFSRFGANRGGTFHLGVDIAAGSGNVPVLAAAAGTVAVSGFSSTAGEWIIIRHEGGLFTRYLHLQSGSRMVQVGATVTAGQQIGRTGTTGATTATSPYLHFEVSDGTGNNATRFNPFDSTQSITGRANIHRNGPQRFTLPHNMSGASA